jgi:hypothetical protein
MKSKNKYNVAARAALFALALTTAFALNTTAIAQAPPGSLWYNGDLNSVNGLANERNTIVTQAAVYDDFVAGSNWHVTAVFSDNLITAGLSITSADWEIRTGVSAGNMGTLVAGGTATGSNLVVTPTGRTAFNYPEQMVTVTGLSINLVAGTRYWLNVTPTDGGTGRSFNSATSGAGCVGTPCGNNQNAFFNSSYFGAFFLPTSAEGQPYDFSNGVIGVPEPATIALLTCGVGALLIAVRRRRSS